MEKAKAVLDSVLENIVKAVGDNGQPTLPSFKDTNKITLPGFGSFEKIIRAPRVCRNPQTGETMKIGERAGVKFKPGVIFKKALK